MSLRRLISRDCTSLTAGRMITRPGYRADMWESLRASIFSALSLCLGHIVRIRGRSTFIFRDQLPGFLRLRGADPDNHPANSGPDILLRLQAGDNRIDSGRTEQTLHYHGFGFLHGVKHGNQFGVHMGLRTHKLLPI
jgi:hypothetical protein